MFNFTRNMRITALITIVLLMGLLPACTTTYEREEMHEKGNGQLTIFLNGPAKAALDITFDLFAVNIASVEGDAREIMSSPVRINSMTLKGRQVLLGERAVPEGTYRKIRLSVKQGLIKRNGRVADLSIPPKAIEIPVNVVIREGQNTSLFLNWNSDASFVDGYRFKPEFMVKSQVPELSTLLIFFTNEGSNNVSAINSQSGEVVANILVGKNPRGIAAVLGSGRARVYVANSGSNTVSIIDPTTNKVESEILIRFGKEPEGVAVAAVSPQKELIYVTNHATNSVSVIDSVTLQELEKINVGFGPAAVVVDPPVEDLLGTRFLDFNEISILRNYRARYFNVYIANEDSNTVSVLIINKETNLSEEVINLDVEWKPDALYVDYQRGKVYVSNYGADKLSVINILEIIKGNEAGAVSTINNVGNYITGIIADPDFERIYLLKEVPGEVVIIRPFEKGLEHMETVMPPVVGTVYVGESPQALILDPEGRKIYVVNSGSNTVSVIDKTTKKEERTIPVGKRPYGIAILRDL